MEKKNNLLVYDASAGSGKTYKLSEKFSDYLLEEFYKGNVDAYRFVMAVTFTNKATFEMKSRIIERLYERAKGISKEDRQLSEKDKENSGLILRHLVHDYTMFRVSTIDSFFQRVLKAFAIEMGSTSSFDTTLDQASAIAAAMDNLYLKLDTDEKLRSAIENISLSRLEDEEYWNWRDGLLEICNRVLDSEYQDYLQASEDSGKMGDISKLFEAELAELDKSFVGEVVKVYDDIQRESANLNLKCLNGSRDMKKFLTGSLADGKKFIDLNNNAIIRRYPAVVENWKNDPGQLNKGASQADIDAIDNKVGCSILSLKHLFDKYFAKYKSLKLIRQNIKETSLLDSVNKELEDYLSKEQLTLLSNAPKILADLIDGSDTPYVYDKIGVTIDHYLLDEFQDTSVAQWKNFKPLLEESLSRNEGGQSGLESMIVGDVKQSIYRFRDGRWELFKDQVEKDFKDYYHKEPLGVNFRSLENIVDFNNILFSPGPQPESGHEDKKTGAPGVLVSMFMSNLADKTGGEEKLTKTIEDIYSNSFQKVCPEFSEASQKGVVHVISCNYDEKEASLKKNEFILQDMVQRINFLTEKVGYKPNEIAVLTDKNSQAGLVANYLVNNNINIVSGESLKLESNKVVSLVVEFLRKLVNPKDKGFEALCRLYEMTLENLAFLDLESEEGLKFLEQIKSCNSLYQICKLVLKTFFVKIDDGDLSYVKAFLDRTLDYSLANGTSISDFLKWWDLSKSGFFIPEPSGGQAVQIMTMHKAKGLGFKVVFIPFLRDDMISTHNYPVQEKVWAALDKEKLGYDGPLLVPFSPDLEDSLYKDYYHKELMERSVDNLNLAYVTFTRAKERLYVYARNGGSSITSVSAALNAYLPAISGDGKMFRIQTETLESGQTITDYVLGDDGESPYKPDNKEETENTVNAEAAAKIVSPVKMDGSMMLKDSSKVKLKGDYGQEDILMKGVLYHELFSYIDGEGNTEGSLEEKVRKAVAKFLRKNPGSILGDDAQTIESGVYGKLSDVQEYGWFGQGNRTLVEQSIVSGEGVSRPDRVILPESGKDWAVVVDFKFGKYEEGSPKDSGYRRQVKGYMRLLRRIGYAQVDGYLWYVMEGKVEKVEL